MAGLIPYCWQISVMFTLANLTARGAADGRAPVLWMLHQSSSSSMRVITGVVPSWVKLATKVARWGRSECPVGAMR